MGSVTNSVSMEDLEALEASGVHGKSKMSYREVVHANAEVFNAGQSKMILSNNHRLQNNEAYPPHSHSKASSREIVAGIYHQVRDAHVISYMLHHYFKNIFTLARVL
jgi:hypothetical protein